MSKKSILIGFDIITDFDSRRVSLRGVGHQLFIVNGLDDILP